MIMYNYLKSNLNTLIINDKNKYIKELGNLL